MRCLLLLLALAAPVAAQNSAPTPTASPCDAACRDLDRARLWATARVALAVGESEVGTRDAGERSADSTLVLLARDVAALRAADAVLIGGDLRLLTGAGQALAFERTLDGDRRVIALNPSDESAFLMIPGDGIPDPLVPVFVSRDAGRVPSLVALFDDDRAVYGLRVPPRTAVVYRPAAAGDVRPRGLDE